MHPLASSHNPRASWIGTHTAPLCAAAALPRAPAAVPACGNQLARHSLGSAALAIRVRIRSRDWSFGAGVWGLGFVFVVAVLDLMHHEAEGDG
jgi:hypothetical protein